MFHKITSKIMVGIFAAIAILMVAYLLFNNFYPSLGADITDKRKALYQNSLQYNNGKFNNTQDVPKDLSFNEKIKLAYTFFTTKVPSGRPTKNLDVLKLDSTNVSDYHETPRMVWFGHSSFLLQIDGKNILLDPMFGQVAAPHDLLGEKRFNAEMPLEMEKLPQIDAVLFSHDHYDHLDYPTIKKINHKVKHYYVPLGLGAHLEAWGVKKNNITEMDWWEETQFESLTLACTPAQHFSGRKLNNNQSTLWSSWVIKSENTGIFFSGDSGYSSHFKEIGTKYGPFDLALMECGQYNEKWSDIHMMPEETAQAGVDVKANKIMPIHWAGFKLALHDWKDPIQRVTAKASELNLEVITPQIGEKIIVKDTVNEYRHWWKQL